MAEALKDRFFQPTFFDKLTKLIEQNNKDFDTARFMKRLYDDAWEGKELKTRMSHASVVLRETLPENYLEALDILKAVCHEFNDFDGMMFPDFVQQFGVDTYAASIDALEFFTQYSSSEFAIRPFILKYEEATMKQMLLWSKHENYHVRRLASEGCRPRLPWAMGLPAFKQDPSLIFPILDNLKSDPELYVRKSVANNLNDIAKDNPELMLKHVEKWQKGQSKETAWIIKHGLRSLIKAGHPKALSLLGYGKSEVKITNLTVAPDKIVMGETVDINFKLTNTSKQPANLVVDYVIHFVKSNGTSSPKVFKLKSIQVDGEATVAFNKSHPIKPITTRKYYAGEHQVDIQVNGEIIGKKSFYLEIL